MTPEQFRSVIAFEDSLKVDDFVSVNWTNSHNYYTAAGRVHKINAKSICVELTEEVEVPYKYPVGTIIRVPRIANFKIWSMNNRVAPDKGQVSGRWIEQEEIRG